MIRKMKNNGEGRRGFEEFSVCILKVFMSRSLYENDHLGWDSDKRTEKVMTILEFIHSDTRSARFFPKHDQKEEYERTDQCMN